MLRVDIKDIDLIVYDFDGVMTDNKVLVFEDGREAVLCNRADGLAIKNIKEMGLPQMIMSTESNPVVKRRAQKLGLPIVSGCEDKKKALISCCKKYNYDMRKVVYIGNDINDLDAMRSVGYPIAPEDASDKVKDAAKAILKKRGGEGVVREFLEKILAV